MPGIDLAHTLRMKPSDAIDRRMIALLQDNARLPLVALAKAVGLSRSAVQERLQRLERSGAIAGYTLRLGPPPLQQVQAWLLLRFADGFSCDDVVPALAARDDVRLCHSVAGDIDLMLLVAVAHLEALASLREVVAAMKGVDDVRTVPVLRVQLDRR
jgi:Lrp/AsnC family transcriptional regulator, leucine-responsive regulatory protein